MFMLEVPFHDVRLVWVCEAQPIFFVRMKTIGKKAFRAWHLQYHWQNSTWHAL